MGQDENMDDSLHLKPEVDIRNDGKKPREEFELCHERTPFVGSTRLGLSLIGLLGLCVIYSQRVDLSVALVCMVNHTALPHQTPTPSTLNSSVSSASSECGVLQIGNDTRTSFADGPFEWSKDLQGNILSSFFYGYLLTQVLGGWMTQRIGGRWVLGMTVLAGSLLTLITPLISHAHVGALITLRVFLGFAQGVTFPGFLTMWGHWAPPLERSMLTGINFAGSQIGQVITLPISGLLCDNTGWQSIFYLFGSLGVVWVICWMLFVTDSPSTHKRISHAEKKYIVSSLAAESTSDNAHSKIPVPWKALLTSPPVWAVFIAHIASDWGLYSMLTNLPSFMKDVLKFDMTSLGFAASVPYLAFFLCINVAGFLADWVRSRGYLSTKNTRKAAMIIGLMGQAVFLVGANYCVCGQEMLVMGFITVSMGLSGFTFAGYLVNYMDIAPLFAGTIMGIGNTLACICGILAPLAMGLITKDHSRESWSTVFWLSFAIMMSGAVFFVIFAKGEVQEWAKHPEELDPGFTDRKDPEDNILQQPLV